ncbi:MAG: DUF983 domain-containing protein [Alphaproteobacteria bacterium]|nr:DUF983 domain-containing protein [Alphaproteobacteria bacterium]
MAGHKHPPVSAFTAAIGCACPRCGRGRLFSGFLEVAPACGVCGLDLRAQDSGDGPAVFIILILGFGVVGLALWLEIAREPPLWLHALLWPPLIVGGSLALLRPMKAGMIALQYRHRTHTFDGLDGQP